MITGNGWAVIVETDTLDDETDNMDAIIADIQKKVNQEWWNTSIRLVVHNAVYMLQMSFCNNHYATNAAEVIKFFEYIAQIAPGSYGLLYLQDDEGKMLSQTFQRPLEDAMNQDCVITVLVMARGQVVRRKDPFLSPTIPRTEEPWPTYTLDRLIPKYLPIGSVVVLKGGEKKLMIFGRYQKDTANDTVYDYVGCPYPEGNIGTKATFLFNHEDIAWIHWLGMSDEEDEALTDKLKELPSNIRPKKGGVTSPQNGS